MQSGPERTTIINRIHGLKFKFGMGLPQKSDTIRRCGHLALEGLPGWTSRAVADLLAPVTLQNQRIAEYGTHLKQVDKEDGRSKRLMQMSGIGPMTATALLAPIGNGQGFKNGRQLAAWLGLGPEQYSFGGKVELGRITKVGEPYLRTLLILGARSVLATAINKIDAISRWTAALATRVGYP